MVDKLFSSDANSPSRKQIVMIKTCYDLWNLQITCYSDEKKRKTPTQTNTKVQDWIHDYHNFMWCSLNCARHREVLRYGILNYRHVTRAFFSTMTWKDTESHKSQKRWGGNLVNTKDGCCLHHCVACAFKQDCTVHTSEKHFENKLWLFSSISSPCV